MKIGKDAWLIGVYTPEVENRIQALGYTLTAVKDAITESDELEEGPAMIVFTEELLLDIDPMFEAQEAFPNAILISLPANPCWTEEGAYSWKERNSAAVNRLLYSIHGREYRWTN